MTRIYTRKGDDGTTSLWYGGRRAEVRPADRGLRRARRGRLGARRRALAAAGRATTELAADILRLQDDLFIAGAELATAPEAAERLVDGVSRVTPEMAAELERADRPLHGPGRAAAEVRDPGRHPALGPARPRPRDPAPRRAARGGARGRERRSRPEAAAASSTAPPTPPTRWPASPTSTIPSCSPAASAHRAEGLRCVVTAPPRRTATPTRSRSRAATRWSIDEPEASGGTDAGPSPTRLGRRVARRLHRDHLRDVRGAQGLGARRRSRSRSTSTHGRELDLRAC